MKIVRAGGETIKDLQKNRGNGYKLKINFKSEFTLYDSERFICYLNDLKKTDEI